ncbi:hypothetical protein OC842_005501 [Tilletia horrida]|uniref:Uncharacterized protein n=1 Tax=Tilletia horrida TaxID=155126 RepID=A0AAN6G7N4_9BASI|nr:hypothetical protein OC842_005501 [Tilletia horrida]
MPTTPTPSFSFQAPRTRLGSSGTASTDDSMAEETQRQADEAAYGLDDDDDDEEDDEDDDDHEDDDDEDHDDHDDDVRTRGHPSHKQHGHEDIDIESVDIDVIFRHPAVRRLLDKLADQNKKFEHLSEEDVRKHPYVSQLLAHVFDLSSRLTTLEQEIGGRDGVNKDNKAKSSSASKAASTPARKTETSSSAVIIQLGGRNGDTEIPLRKRRFYSRKSAVKAFAGKTVSMPSVICKVICNVFDNKPVSEERFAELKDAAEDEVGKLHRLPNTPCGLKHKTIGYYNHFHSSSLVDAINELTKDNPELQSKENWKGRALIDSCLRGSRKRNPAFVPSSRSALPATEAEELAEEEAASAFGHAPFASDPPILSPSSLIIANAQSSSIPPTGIAVQPRRSYAQLDYSSLGRAIGREIPNLPDTSSSFIASSTATGDPVFATQSSPSANAQVNIPAQTRSATHNAAATPSATAATAFTSDVAQAVDAGNDAHTCNTTAAAHTGTPAFVIDIDGMDREVGRYLCQARDAMFKMTSNRPAVKKALYGFNKSNPFTQAELHAAQAKAAHPPTTSPQKRKQRATTGGSPSKRQATTSRAPFSALDNVESPASLEEVEHTNSQTHDG